MNKQTQDHIVDVNKKVTAVEWLEQEFIALQNYGVNELGLFTKAIEMEKQQIIDARQDGFNRCFRKGDRKEITNEDYYNKTFNK
jgi:hypothetical protein